jgi:uncharacterized lipoprotein NlpE involved in copper resistance
MVNTLYKGTTMMTKKTVILISLLFALSGCNNAQENQAAHDAKVAAQAKAELREELKREEIEKAKLHELELQKNNKLAHMGITTTNGKLIIDTDKTKSFFQQMAANLKVKADKFAKDMQEGTIDDKEAGIEITKTHVNIDLNKTKGYLDKWGKVFESYAKEFQKMTEEIDSNK